MTGDNESGAWLSTGGRTRRGTRPAWPGSGKGISREVRVTAPHIAVLRRTDGLPWSTAVFAVRVPAQLALAPDPA
jgi:hypothetical protein